MCVLLVDPSARRRTRGEPEERESRQRWCPSAFRGVEENHRWKIFRPRRSLRRTLNLRSLWVRVPGYEGGRGFRSSAGKQLPPQTGSFPCQVSARQLQMRQPSRSSQLFEDRLRPGHRLRSRRPGDPGRVGLVPGGRTRRIRPLRAARRGVRDPRRWGRGAPSWGHGAANLAAITHEGPVSTLRSAKANTWIGRRKRSCEHRRLR